MIQAALRDIDKLENETERKRMDSTCDFTKISESAFVFVFVFVFVCMCVDVCICVCVCVRV